MVVFDEMTGARGSVEWGPERTWEPRETGVDVWCGDLKGDSGAARSLSVEERARADRFVVRERGESFIAGRASLRRILSRYLGCSPAEIQFDYGAHGKPRLRGDGPQLHFNLSHSGAKFVLAVSRECAVGIDIEQARADRRLVEIGRRFFAPEEHARMCAEGAENLVDHFYRLWACKEAYLKVHGTGFSFPAANFCVSMAQHPPRVEWTRLEGDVASSWCLDALSLPFAGYRAALCSAREGDVRAFLASGGSGT